MEFIDIGANLCHPSFDMDREAALDRARDAGVRRVIVTGSDQASSENASVLARSHAGRLFSTVGLHPHAAAQFGQELIERFRELAARPEVVAIGEAGLDFFRELSPRVDQERAFHAQLRLATELHMPVFLHQREAHVRFLPILREYLPDLPAAVVHCFTGTGEEIDDYLSENTYIGITGWICDERRGQHLRELVGRIPNGRLMLETDAPYLLPRDLRPKPKSRRNEPMLLAHVAAAVAAARGQTLHDLAAHTTAAAETFFDLHERAPAEAPKAVRGEVTQ